MVSMKDLAAACNVSIATVSKALNDQHDVSAKTKEMVRRKAKELSASRFDDLSGESEIQGI